MGVACCTWGKPVHIYKKKSVRNLKIPLWKLRHKQLDIKIPYLHEYFPILHRQVALYSFPTAHNKYIINTLKMWHSSNIWA
jgi:hypothetical protein